MNNPTETLPAPAALPLEYAKFYYAVEDLVKENFRLHARGFGNGMKVKYGYARNGPFILLKKGMPMEAARKKLAELVAKAEEEIRLDNERVAKEKADEARYQGEKAAKVAEWKALLREAKGGNANEPLPPERQYKAINNANLMLAVEKAYGAPDIRINLPMDLTKRAAVLAAIDDLLQAAGV